MGTVRALRRTPPRGMFSVKSRRMPPRVQGIVLGIGGSSGGSTVGAGMRATRNGESDSSAGGRALAGSLLPTVEETVNALGRNIVPPGTPSLVPAPSGPLPPELPEHMEHIEGQEPTSVPIDPNAERVAE
jgi:hypothetical protein